MSRVVFIIDDQRHEDYCYELNGVTRLDDDVVILSKDAMSAAYAIMALAEQGIEIDIFMLDHDLGDGKDTSWWLNFLLGMLLNDSIIPDDFMVLEHIAPYIQNSEWFIHTSNAGMVKPMQGKIDAIKIYVEDYLKGGSVVDSGCLE